MDDFCEICGYELDDSKKVKKDFDGELMSVCEDCALEGIDDMNLVLPDIEDEE